MKKILVPIVTVFVILLIGTIVYQKLEQWSWVDSLYFATTSLTTGGYGNIYLKYDTSKLFTIIYILGGLSTVLYELTQLGSSPRLEKVVDKSIDKLTKAVGGKNNGNGTDKR